MRRKPPFLQGWGYKTVAVRLLLNKKDTLSKQKLLKSDCVVAIDTAMKNKAI